MATRTFKDWKSWRDGLRSCVARAAATAVVTQLTAMGGTSVAATIPGLQGIALQWKQAGVLLLIQFVYHSLFAAASYIQQNPDPQIVITQDTTFVSKTDAGTISQSSKTVTTTPTAP